MKQEGLQSEPLCPLYPIFPPQAFWQISQYEHVERFFETGSDPALFEGLKIMREKDLCEKYMGKFPVISIRLKGVGGLNYKDK